MKRIFGSALVLPFIVKTLLKNTLRITGAHYTSRVWLESTSRITMSQQFSVMAVFNPPTISRLLVQHADQYTCTIVHMPNPCTHSYSYCDVHNYYWEISGGVAIELNRISNILRLL